MRKPNKKKYFIYIRWKKAIWDRFPRLNWNSVLHRCFLENFTKTSRWSLKIKTRKKSLFWLIKLFSQQIGLNYNSNFFSSFKIELVAKGTGADVPIWIENPNIDLKICMYDRLYQDVIQVHNRSNAALRITFELPNEIKNHMEILPKTAFIQAKAEFQGQLKFIARSSLKTDARQYFDSELGVLEVPLHIKVADQVSLNWFRPNPLRPCVDLTEC